MEYILFITYYDLSIIANSVELYLLELIGVK